MTVLIGLNLEDGVLIAADRGTTLGPTLCDGAGPTLESDRSKVSVNNHGVAIGQAGLGGIPAGDEHISDLIDGAAEATRDHHSPSGAAAAVLDLFTIHAAGARTQHAATAEGAFTATPLSRPALTVAVIAGLSTMGTPSMFAVGLTTSGPCELHTISEAGVTYAPATCQADIEAMVLDPTLGTSMQTAVNACGERIAQASATAPAMVSASWDLVEVTRTAGTLKAHHAHVLSLPRN